MPPSYSSLHAQLWLLHGLPVSASMGFYFLTSLHPFASFNPASILLCSCGLLFIDFCSPRLSDFSLLPGQLLQSFSWDLAPPILFPWQPLVAVLELCPKTSNLHISSLWNSSLTVTFFFSNFSPQLSTFPLGEIEALELLHMVTVSSQTITNETAFYDKGSQTCTSTSGPFPSLILAILNPTIW